MNPMDETELRLATKKMYQSGNTPNVLDCLMEMLRSQIVICETLKEILKNEKN